MVDAAPAPPPGGPFATAPSAIVLASDEETRVLLRGLLRLNHYRVIAESDDPRQIADLVATQRPQLLVADTGPMQTPVHELLQKTRSSVTDLRIVVVTGAGKAGLSSGGIREADAVLVRPFRVSQFAEAVAARRP